MLDKQDIYQDLRMPSRFRYYFSVVVLTLTGMVLIVEYRLRMAPAATQDVVIDKRQIVTTQYVHYSASESATKRLDDVINSERFRSAMQQQQQQRNNESKVKSADSDDLADVIRQLSDRGKGVFPPQTSLFTRQTPQYKEVISAFKKKRRGTFMECGGYDGETSSNTLPLEVKHGWSGILIEPNPYYYTQLVGKNRNVTSLNACISTEPTASLLHVPLRCPEYKQLGCQQQSFVSSASRKDTINIPCFPFSSIMDTFGFKSLDYFSLDVEGAEMAILRTIPFDKYPIKMMSIEYKHTPGGKEAITELMTSHNYRLVKQLDIVDRNIGLFVYDLIFILKT